MTGILDALQEAPVKNFLRVPYCKSVYGEEEIQAVIRVLRTSTQMGDSVRLMESKVAALFAKKYGIMVNSGSSANYLAVEILDLPEGSEVITPVLTFSTTVAPLVRGKLIPVFVDVEEDTYNIDVSKIEALITPKTKALMIPNLIGNLPDWEQLHEIAKKYNLLVIEDSADTLGATLNGTPTGLYSDISTTSFYGSHVIHCAGNGGMLCVNNEALANKAKLLRSWGRSSSLFVESEKVENRFDVSLEGIAYDNKFVFEEFGYNLEPSEMGAAFGLVQIEKLQDYIDKREYWFQRHIQFFKKYQDWFSVPKPYAGSRSGWISFPVVIKNEAPFKRRDLQIFLEKRNIQTRTVFTGNILKQPCFSKKTIPYKRQKEEFVNANTVMQGGMLIACHHGLDEAMIQHTHESIQIFCNNYSVRH